MYRVGQLQPISLRESCTDGFHFIGALSPEALLRISVEQPVDKIRNDGAETSLRNSQVGLDNFAILVHVVFRIERSEACIDRERVSECSCHCR